MSVVASFSCFVGSSNANVLLFIQLWSQHLRWQYSYSLSQLGDPMKIGDTISSRRRTFVWCAGQRRTVFERTFFPMNIESMYLGDCSSLMLVSIKIIPVMCIASTRTYLFLVLQFTTYVQLLLTWNTSVFICTWILHSSHINLIEYWHRRLQSHAWLWPNIG